MKKLFLIMPGEISDRLSKMVKAATEGINTYIIDDDINMPDLRNKKIVFAVELDNLGYNIPVFQILSKLSKRGRDALYGSNAVLIIHSSNELYTKSTAQDIIFKANQMGCRFPGHPLIEAIKDLKNFRTWQKCLNLSLDEISLELCRKLGMNLIDDIPRLINRPRIVALHASSHVTSNTLMLWNMTKEHLKNCDIEEYHVENGTIVDCKGCSYTTCMHYSKQNSCFYGGMITKEILPAIERADAVIWICPNYNDAISAKLMAIINRMTVLYRRIKLNRKTLFGVIVSGNSGSDSVAKQLIGALNINKGFRLPPYFAIMAIANDPGEIMKVEGINEKAKEFANIIMSETKA
ncbi:flavodoxin family protein [Paramaledivibacter caminithermalis]|uniref:NADPH-dependent FMN reductase n=1 Tax=Paramaledivibacter caminithermalis (strain DSM 15212 / CIP 107654 / DViRD3) TaxID=1121301 RepID=A0A1M6NNL2_PARC5|nr:NAD(P)H-dependent oxidoreductase [Paramaledivibacter caminithermalis]SHJ97152.1 NADPH-dependent FMN reductase [Paramaledivibacter caminithermalis DSM 15212]